MQRLRKFAATFVPRELRVPVIRSDGRHVISAQIYAAPVSEIVRISIGPLGDHRNSNEPCNHPRLAFAGDARRTYSVRTDAVTSPTNCDERRDVLMLFV